MKRVCGYRGKIRLLGEAGVCKTLLIMKLMNNIAKAHGGTSMFGGIDGVKRYIKEFHILPFEEERLRFLLIVAFSRPLGKTENKVFLL